MRDLEQPCRLRRIRLRLDRAGLGRAVDREPGATEDEQVEVELARTPAPPAAAPEVALEALQRREERRRARRRIRACRNVERDDRVAEVGLIGDADRGGDVQPGDAPKPHAGERGQRARPPRPAFARRRRRSPRARRRLGRSSRSRALHGALDRLRGDARRRGLDPPPGTGSRRGPARAVGRRRAVPDRAPPPRRLPARRRCDGRDRLRPARRYIVRRAAPRAGRGSATPPERGDRAWLRCRSAGDDPRSPVIRRDRGRGEPTALANNRYSADVVSIACAESLLDLPDLPADNALPRWLEEVAGYQVDDLRHRWRLAFDVDGPLDLLLMGRASESSAGDVGTARARLDAVAAVAADRRAELVVAGRTSASTLRWLETAARARDPGADRGTRHARSQRPGPGRRSGRAAAAARRPCSACSSIVTARRPSGAISNGWAMPRWSIRACCSPIGSVSTSATGRPPRTVSRRTCCSPTASPIRGCAS